MEARVGVDGARKFLHQQPRPQQPQISQIGTVPQLLAGGIAGAFSKTCTAPLARLTILFQVNYLFSNPYSSFCFILLLRKFVIRKKLSQICLNVSKMKNFCFRKTLFLLGQSLILHYLVNWVNSV